MKTYLWIIPDSGHGTLIEHKDDYHALQPAVSLACIQVLTGIQPVYILVYLPHHAKNTQWRVCMKYESG